MVKIRIQTFLVMSYRRRTRWRSRQQDSHCGGHHVCDCRGHFDEEEAHDGHKEIDNILNNKVKVESELTRDHSQNSQRTVINNPQTNVAIIVIATSFTAASLTPNSSLSRPPPSPARIRSDRSTTALMGFVYHDGARALPPTTLRLYWMTTECVAARNVKAHANEEVYGDRRAP